MMPRGACLFSWQQLKTGMSRLLIFLPVLSLAIGCASTRSTAQGEPTEAAVLNAWFEDLDRENFTLHDTLLEALFVSRRTGKTVFVLRVTVEGAKTPPHLYRVSLERGGADNIVGVNHASREFLFDHFLPSDGPTLNQVRRRVRDDAAIRKIKKDLKIFGIK